MMVDDRCTTSFVIVCVLTLLIIQNCICYSFNRVPQFKIFMEIISKYISKIYLPYRDLNITLQNFHIFYF